MIGILSFFLAIAVVFGIGALLAAAAHDMRQAAPDEPEPTEDSDENEWGRSMFSGDD